MSCNGCRVLRKGCSETCMLRPCLQWIDTAEAQGHATVFVAKFFGRAGLMSFISAVPETQRPALFKSLLYESCGRTVNPVNGAVGLLWAGNWHLCQAAVETVLRGGTLRPIPELLTGAPPREVELDEVSEGEVVTCNISRRSWNKDDGSNNSAPKIKRVSVQLRPSELDLSLAAISPAKLPPADKRRLGSPSMNSEASVATSGFDYGTGCAAGRVEPRLLNLFC